MPESSWPTPTLSLTDQQIIDRLLEAGFKDFCLVADSVFATMDQYLMDLAAAGRVNRYVLPSERSLPAVATGHWLATGHPMVMMMQNSGFSNAMDYLRTVMQVHQIPGLVLSSWRGHDARIDDSEPHILIGDLTETDCLNTHGSEHVFGLRTGEKLAEALNEAIDDVRQGNLACLRIAPPGLKKTYPLKPIGDEQIPYASPTYYEEIKEKKGLPFRRVMETNLLTRDEALVKIYSETLHLDPFYIVGNGYNPRAMQALRISPDTFENAGGMGSSLGIAWGAAKACPDQIFIAIDGDQNAMMNEMEKVLCSDYPDNLYWYILNNGTGESVGTSVSLPLTPWHYDLARVINTRNEIPGAFNYPRINASGLKFEHPDAQALAGTIGNLPAEAIMARQFLIKKMNKKK